MLEDISIQIGLHHRMSKAQFSHIRVLLAGLAPVPHIAMNLPDPATQVISSDEKDHAATAKDQPEDATGVAGGSSKDKAESEDVAKQT